MNNRYPQNERAIPQFATEASTIFLAKVFNWMAIGLGLTGITAFLVASSQTALQLILGNKLLFFGFKRKKQYC